MISRGAAATMLIVLNVTILLPAAAAGQARAAPQFTHDTTFIRSTGVGLWGPPSTAVEDLRLGGGQSPQEFGSVDCFAALPGGGVAAYDSRGPNGPVLLVFDQQGKLRHSLGRGGGGPGEFGTSKVLTCLVVARDGTILLSDRANNRVNRWTSTGKLLASIPLPPGAYGTGQKVLPGPDRSVYVRVALSTPRAGVGVEYGYVRLGEDGQVLDTLPRLRPLLVSNPPKVFDPREFIMPLPDGRVVHTFSDRLAFTISGPAAARTVLSVSREVPVVRTIAEERREYEAEAAFRAAQTQGAWPNSGVAPTKPASADMRVDPQGRVWFQRNVVAVKGEMILPPAMPNQPTPPGHSYLMPPVFAAFDDNGRYLGEVRIPLRQEVLANFSFADEFIWGRLTDDDGFPVLVRWRIPGGVR